MSVTASRSNPLFTARMPQPVPSLRTEWPCRLRREAPSKRHIRDPTLQLCEPSSPSVETPLQPPPKKTLV
eukprot:357433-Chlamydomonas_euryale.AAC.10